tara:strand:+ start:6611 stop:6922 length:312 start_codon:yes stop_codon:yes gene_type:complete
MEVTVEIFINKMTLSANGSSKIIFPEANYSSNRLLVGSYLNAVDCLEKGLKEIGAKSLFRFRKPILKITPKELIDGGLSEVETRVLLELGYGAGAKKVILKER